MLRTICRKTGGRQYLLLREALARLQATSIVTNIRVQRGKKHPQFSWIESWTDLVDEGTDQSRGMSLTLSEWFYEGILMDGGLLSVDPVYFPITRGRERWLYRAAHKHAGGAGEEGFAIPLRTLFEKSGAEGTYRRFKFEVQAIVRRNDLPGFALALEMGKGEPMLRMVRQDVAAPPPSPIEARPIPAQGARRRRPGERAAKKQESLPVGPRNLSERALARIRGDFPGWHVLALQAEFDSWLDGQDGRAPRSYEAAFYGFVRRLNARGGA